MKYITLADIEKYLNTKQINAIEKDLRDKNLERSLESFVVKLCVWWPMKMVAAYFVVKFVIDYYQRWCV